MKLLIPIILSLSSSSVFAINVLLSNDDGWAEANIRQFYTSLKSAGFNVLMSAPADNESGTGSSDATPKARTSACEFNTCSAGSATGTNSSDTRLNWVNSFPVTSVKFGLQNLSSTVFGGPPDIVVAGPNVGANLGSTTQISGTVGAATEGALSGIPSIAFSGTSGSQVSYTSAVQTYQTVYASLSTKVTSTVITGGGGSKPFLPSGIFLNVNFPTVSSSTCSSAASFKFALSRINSASSSTAADVTTCGSNRLPTESSVVARSGCWVSISVGMASTKNDVSAATQQVVLNRLGNLLSCQ